MTFSGCNNTLGHIVLAVHTGLSVESVALDSLWLNKQTKT